MFRDLLLGQYYPAASPVHRLDPRTKILATLAYVGLLFLVDRLWGYGVATGFTLLTAAVARIPPRLLLRSLRPVLLLLILTVVLHALMSGREGASLAQLGPLRVTDEGLATGIHLGLRLGLLMVISSLLTLSTSPIEITDGMERLLNPFRRLGVPAHELAMMMTIALRFIPTLTDEADRIMKAQMARGVDFQAGGFVARARNLVPILVPLFISAFRRAEDLAVAMESRCYRGGEGRSRFRPLRMGWRDAAAGLLATAILVVTLWVGR